jgi:hypothetical protein
MIKLNFRKVSAIGASLLLTGMSMGVAAAVAYPAPFIEGGVANAAIVYGTGEGVSTLDLVQAGNIQSNLQSKMGSSVGSSSSVSGESRSLNSGSDLLYLLDDLSENLQTITKDDLPTILADGDFVDNAGSSWEFEQTIAIGTSTTNRLSFGNSDNDFDDPAMMLELSTGTGTPMYTWTINFDKATNFTASDSEGEEISIFGKTYTIGTATDDNTLILLGGADITRVNVDETATMTVGGVNYDVLLEGLSSATTTQAGITVNGESKTFTEGQTKTYIVDGVELEVYAKTIFRTGDDGSGYIEVSLGSNKLTLETGNALQVGADTTDIDGTLVTFTPATSTGVTALTKMQIAVAAEDSDVNHILSGESFTDPIFGTLKLELSSIMNGPTFTAEKDTGRTALELKSGGSRELQVVITDGSGITKTVPFSFEDILQDDSRNNFVQVEGNNLTDNDYFFLNSGDYEHLMRVTKVNLGSITTSDLEIMDVFTGTKYLLENKDFTAGQNVTINSQTYVFTNLTNSDGDSGGFNITSADAYAGTHRALFPYMELVAGEDFPRVTFINQTNKINDGSGDNITAASNTAGTAGRIYELPTGTIQFKLYDLNISSPELYAGANISWLEYQTVVAGTTSSWANVSGVGAEEGTQFGNFSGLVVGEAVYTFGFDFNTAGASSVLIDNVSIDGGLTTARTTDATALANDIDSPVIMFVEDKDKSDSDTRNVIVINTTDDETYSEMNGDILFSGSSEYDSQAWDDTKLKGYVTNYGTYALRDQTDTNIHVASLTYGNAQMYADVYFAEAAAVITAGTSSSGGVGQLGDVLYKDSESANYASKNVIVVGGSCINSAAATLLGGSYCGADFTTNAGAGAGEFVIKGFATSTLTSELALLVAGYDVADTVNAATYLRNNAVDTSSSYKGTSATSAELVVA